jgi:hypothetical protein
MFSCSIAAGSTSFYYFVSSIGLHAGSIITAIFPLSDANMQCGFI